MRAIVRGRRPQRRGGHPRCAPPGHTAQHRERGAMAQPLDLCVRDSGLGFDVLKQPKIGGEQVAGDVCAERGKRLAGSVNAPVKSSADAISECFPTRTGIATRSSSRTPDERAETPPATGTMGHLHRCQEDNALQRLDPLGLDGSPSGTSGDTAGGSLSDSYQPSARVHREPVRRVKIRECEAAFASNPLVLDLLFDVKHA